MKMRCEMTAVRHKIDDLVGEQVRFTTRYSDSIVSVQLVESPQQVNKMFVRRTTEITDVDATENQFLRPTVQCLLRLLYERCDGGVSTLAARQRNGAIRAEIIASVLHFDEAARAVILAVRPVKIIDLADRREENF